MIRTILIIFVVFMALSFIVMWILSGSFGRIADQASVFTNFFGLRFGESTTSLPAFQLPWQIGVPQGPDIQKELDEQNSARPRDEQIAELEGEVNALEEEVNVLPRQKE